MDKKDKSKLWICLFLDSLRADLRIAGEHKFADMIRNFLEEYVDYKSVDLPIKQLKEYRDIYREKRNMPEASIVELEMS